MNPAEVLAFGVTRSFGPHEALRGVDLALQGGLITLLGPNGSGKTTLMRCLATVTAPDGGSILIDGLDGRHESDRIEIRRRLGYQPQEPGMSRSSTVFDLLDYLAVLKGHTDDRARRHGVHAALERVGLGDRLRDRVGDLSGGMRQRLALAQATFGSPTLLLLDEPAAGLDPDERFRLREIVAERRHAATVIVSTHLTDEAAVGDRVLVLLDGRLRYVGSPDSLARTAAGRTWIQEVPPGPVRASWRLADGRYRCLGQPPPGVTPVAPTLEDGYLLLTAEHGTDPDLG
ncbi:MAG: ATP-binding cassette domain-containing protein [Actinomycetota bacterium]